MQGTPAGLPFGMPGIGDVIDGAVQQAPQPLRHGKASAFMRHYKPDWANSAPAVKVSGSGETCMESADRDTNPHAAPDSGSLSLPADAARSLARIHDQMADTIVVVA